MSGVPITLQAAPEEPGATGSYQLLGPGAVQHGRRFIMIGIIGYVAAVLYFAVMADVADVLHLYQGLAILGLGLLPLLLWFKNGGSRFPAFEAMLLLCISSYALPLLNGHEQLALYSPRTVTQAAWAVLAFQAAGILAYVVTPGRPARGRFWSESILTREAEKTVSYGIFLSTAYIGITNFTTWVPRDLESLLRAVFYGIGTLCTFVTTQRWGRGELSHHESWIFGGMLILQLLFMALTLLLVQSITLMGIALMGFLSGGRRVPWRMMLVAFGVTAILHNGKYEMRRLYWDGGKSYPSFMELPAYYAEWIGYGVNPPESERDKTAGRRLIERTSLMHILCLVAEYSPHRQPFLGGQTYAHVLPQLIPRFFWPDKPWSHISTYELSIYYGLQDEDATRSTTIAFGQLAEAYANFGLLGCIGLGVVFGFLIRKLQHWSRNSPLFSLAGLMMILVTAWSLNSELTMAAWVSSLYQALIAALGLPLILRGLIGL